MGDGKEGLFSIFEEHFATEDTETTELNEKNSEHQIPNPKQTPIPEISIRPKDAPGPLKMGISNLFGLGVGI
jgi:hypothetical protein